MAKTINNLDTGNTIFKVDIEKGVILDRLFEKTTITYDNNMYNNDGTRKKEYFGRYYLNKTKK